MSIKKKTLPLLTLRDVIIFPGTIAPIFIGREKSLNSLLAAKKIEDGQRILLTTQKKQDIEDPKTSDLFKIGVLAKITNKKINLEILNILSEQKNPSYITNIIASHLTCKLAIKQNLLEEVDVLKRAEMLTEIITTESTHIDTEQSVQQRVKKQIEKTQRFLSK